MMRWRLVLAAALAPLLMAQSAPDRDPANPTCPQQGNWTDFREMQLTPVTRDGRRILLAEGAIDPGLPERLRLILERDESIGEIWIRSPGGNARAGTAAGRIIRNLGLVTRIPSGWTCFSACNFMFMGGAARIIDPGGVFMVHMFTFTNDRGAIRQSVEGGTDQTAALIGDVEQESALLASEDNDFLIRMGISRRLLTEVMYQQRAVAAGGQAAQRYCLNAEEAQRYNVQAVPRAG